MKIYIGADHGGFELKSKIIDFLKARKYGVVDCGAYQLNVEDDYPLFAKEVCKKIMEDTTSKGILICRSGIGMSITANKFKGIYAALCTSNEQSQRAIEHNHANVLCLDSEFIDENLNLQIVEEFFKSNEDNEERHLRRIKEIKELE